MATHALICETNDQGCHLVISHKLNKDGYFRRKWNGKWVMWHRFVWEQAHGPIPEGFEINHKCKNRSCCNIDHLELLSGQDHAIETNESRYAQRLIDAEHEWRNGASAKKLSSLFGVTESCAYRWIRTLWKNH